MNPDRLLMRTPNVILWSGHPYISNLQNGQRLAFRIPAVSQ